jgi:hypothetical protein
MGTFPDTAIIVYRLPNEKNKRPFSVCSKTLKFAASIFRLQQKKPKLQFSISSVLYLWKPGNVKPWTWRQGDMETWRHRHGDRNMDTWRHLSEKGSLGDFP